MNSVATSVLPFQEETGNDSIDLTPTKSASFNIIQQSMQKRKAAPPILPLVSPSTSGDLSKMRSSRNTSRVSRRRPSSWDGAQIGKVLFWGLGLVLGGTAVMLLLPRMTNLSGHGRTQSSPFVERRDQEMFDEGVRTDDATRAPGPLLGSFESLAYATKHSKLLALYFAASWCPMSTPITQLIHQLLDDILVAPPPLNATTTTEVEQPSESSKRLGDLSLIYVSSDRTAREMETTVGNKWIVVPFDSPDKDELKRFFKTCAKREVAQLQIQREREIPTLIILAGETHQVLTYDGVHDVRELREKALDHWLELLQLAQALNAKYDII